MTESVNLSGFGLDPKTVSRWRNRLKDSKKFDEQIIKAQERCIKVCETPNVLYPRAVNSGNNEWYTPAEYVEAVRDVFLAARAAGRVSDATEIDSPAAGSARTCATRPSGYPNHPQQQDRAPGASAAARGVEARR